MKKISISIIVILFLFSCDNKETEENNFLKMSISELGEAIKKDTSNAFLYQIRGENFYKISKIDSALSDYQKMKRFEIDCRTVYNYYLRSQ